MSTGATEAPVGRHVRLGIDVGDARVGLASSDPDGLIATPVRTLERSEALSAIVDFAHESDVRVIMIGLPRSLSGTEGPAAGKARAFASELATVLASRAQEAEIRFVDERLTTVDAHQALHRSGRKGRKHRAVVDQVAAVMILQQALDMERATGAPAGELLEGHGDDEEETTT